MKKVFSLLIVTLWTSLFGLYAQIDEAVGTASSEDPCIINEHKLSSWRLDPITGSRIFIPLDTASFDLYRKDVPDDITVSYNHLGNFGLPGESRIFFDRLSKPNFIFLSAYDRFNVTPEHMRYYNTQIPYTAVEYLTGGSKVNAEDRFIVDFAGNIKKNFGVGTSLDYIYTRGFYNFQGVNTLTWQLYGYYTGEKYQIYAYTNIAKLGNQENGGIQNRDYILNPEEVNSNLSDPKNIPVNITKAWNRTKHRDFYFTQKYNLGFDKKTVVSDSISYSEFVPVSSFFHTFHLSSDDRKFRIDETSIITDGYFENSYLDKVYTNDTLSYLSVKNTLGITLNEGFNKYAKFGLAAYAAFEYRRYTNMQDTADLSFIARDFKTPILSVGAQLSKTQGSILKYHANAEFVLSGYNVGDIDVNGQIQTKIPIKNDSLIIRAKGHYKLNKPNYYYNHYFSNHFKWDNDFKREQRARIMGELEVPYTRTRISAGVENLTQYLYFNNKALPEQFDGNIQVLEARLEQDIKWGIFHWNNDLVYQKSSNQTALPLPDLSIYSQMFINFRIARVLQTQIGMDCHLHTRYYGQSYQPATQMFHNQDIAKVGNYPLVNVYANMKLKGVRFFVMMYHVNQNLFGGNDYFLSPYQPMNPRMFKFGASIEFAN